MSFAPPMTMTCELVTTTRNEYGDFTETAATTSACWYREISTVRGQAHSEVRDSDATIWLPAGTAIAEGDIIRCEGKTLEVDRYFNARRLGGTPQFVKAELTILDLGLIS